MAGKGALRKAEKQAAKKSTAKLGGKASKAKAASGAEAPLGIGRLLVAAAARVDRRMLEIINDSGFPGVRLAHLHVPRHLPGKGLHLTALAERAGMAKQSMGQIVDQCEAMGLIERRTDEADRRAKIIVYTEEGERLVSIAAEALRRAEAEMAAEIGGKRVKQVAKGLTAYAGGAAA